LSSSGNEFIVTHTTLENGNKQLVFRTLNGQPYYQLIHNGYETVSEVVFVTSSWQVCEDYIWIIGNDEPTSDPFLWPKNIPCPPVTEIDDSTDGNGGGGIPGSGDPHLLLIPLKHQMVALVIV